MLNAHEVAKWYIFNNPELASGYIDENTKVNKLLYFSNLMYKCVKNEALIIDDFIAFPNGPVVFSVYRDYRYNGLNELPTQCPIIEGLPRKVLEIINFVYGNYSAQELVEESHTHSLWRNVSHMIPNNPIIHFENVDNFKMSPYYIIMKFKVEKLPQAEAEINSLEESQQKLLADEYAKIETQGIEFVRVKPIQKDIFEIKSNELRSLFKYKAGKIIVVGVVFVKKTQKTPKDKIKLAKQRLKEV